ncbi:3-deoxy-manno-octulosonate cytidylyltransferase, partial [bacterium]|nr:3-deoxy-manno-octulosonate cytidylyltransferase [bacterium]
GWQGPVLNWQGDEPLLRADDALAAVALLERFAVGTLAAPFRGDAEDRNRVKVQRAADGEALDFSRAPFAGGGPALEHVGVYAYRADALEAWVAAPPALREEEESLEQLRAQAAGIRIGVALIAAAPPGVNVPQDIDRVRPLLRSD